MNQLTNVMRVSEKIARTQKDKDSVAEFNILQKIKPVLEDGKSARTIDFTEEEQKLLRDSSS